MNKRGNIYWSDFRRSDGERIRRTLKTSDPTAAVIAERAMMAEEEEKLRLQRLQESAGKERPKHLMTFQEGFERCLKRHDKWRDSTSPATIQANFRHCCAVLAAHGGKDIPLIDLSAYPFHDLADEMEEEGLSASTINQRLSLYSVVLKHAEHWAETRGKVKCPRMPRRKPAEGRIRWLDWAEETFFTTCLRASGRPKGPRMADLVEVLADTGLRLSEALRLRNMDLEAEDPPDGRLPTEIDLEGRLILVWSAKAGNPMGLPMTARVAAILERLKDEPYPFGCFTKDSAENEWAWAKKHLKKDKDKELVIHALRHTTATRLARQGWDVARIQRFMRHKRVQTTLRYVHMAAEDLRDMAHGLSAPDLAEAPNVSQNEAQTGAPRAQSSGVI